MGEKQHTPAVGVQGSVHMCECHESVWWGSLSRLSHSAEGRPFLQLSSRTAESWLLPGKGQSPPATGTEGLGDVKVQTSLS